MPASLKLFIVVVIAFLFGCVHVLANVPVAAKIQGSSEILLGNAVGYSDGVGKFEARNIDGLSCRGVYNSLSRVPTIDAKIECSDGRQGIIIITRTSDLLSGSGVGKLGDGSAVKFVFGDLVHSRNAQGFWEKF